MHERRFGTLPDDALEREIAAKVEPLETWSLQAPTATKLEDVLGEESPTASPPHPRIPFKARG